MTRSLLFLALCSCTGAYAASPVVDNASIDNSGQGYKGNLSINQASGDGQQQNNSRAIAIGTDAHATTQIRQRIDTPASSAVDAHANIGNNTFTNGTGMIGINQSAGANTQQANAVRISISALPQNIDDSVLGQQNVALLNGSDSTDHAPGSRQVTLGDQAFTGSRGVIQLNQSAGVGNRMANTLSVRVAD
ncbi:adhesin [Pseudomonas fontis]|uniref:Adhesin n=1 Tax=Pseudomonas fontis TaxID=2942633 RepID=A0ABT5NXU1_9PSED|nr:adhesin [Pseudomonas fontis]MDD0972485.1 adhesin [Pseudomonas fontis]MDD0993009.1 adhesin [Pseudomonas fontis]